MDEGSTVLITLQPLKPNDNVPLPKGQELNIWRQHVTKKIKTTKHVRLKPSTQTWVEVTMKRDGTILVYPKKRYKQTSCV